MELLFQFGYFVLYSFLGWACETIYCSCIRKRFINRGFLNGPFCPVYGFGALLVINLFGRYQDDLLALFLLSVIVTSAVEYVTSFAMEKLFHLSLWDYSGRKWNLNGRVCLHNSLLFGVLSVLMVRVIHPWVIRMFEAIPPWLIVAVLSVLAAYFIADLSVSAAALVRINRVAGKRQLELEHLAGLRDEIRSRSKERLHTVHKRLLKAFPNMKSPRFPEALQEMQELIKKRKKR
jgi:uncharacterized membrane protein